MSLEFESRTAATTAENGDAGVALPQAPRPDRGAVAAFWKSRFKRRKSMEDFTKWEESCKSARSFFKGDLLNEKEVADWQGPTAKHNGWRRIASYFWDAVYSNNPNPSVRPAEGRGDPAIPDGASAMEAMLKYVARETKLTKEFLRVLKASYFDNVASAKIEFDPIRGLIRAKWCPGVLLVDSQAHGDLSRAMWVAEEARVSRATVLGDKMFPIEKRAKLAEFWGGKSGPDGAGYDSEVLLYYVESREGVDPQGAIAQVAGGMDPADQPKACFVICEEWPDDFLYESNDPAPWLDVDEYRYPTCIMEEIPGDWFGSQVWQLVQPTCNAINWLLSFYITAVKKRSTDIHLWNKAQVKDFGKIAEGRFAENHGVDGDPNTAHARVDLGAGDNSALLGAEQLQQWLDRASGHNEVARGESSGRKTAEESRNLQQNTSLVTKGPARSFDEFMEETYRQIGLATIIYVPSFSWKIGPGGEVMTRKAQMVQPPPALDPMTGQPQMDPMTGQPVMGPPVPQVLDVPVPPAEAAKLGAQDLGPELGLRMPGVEVQDAMPQVGPDGLPTMGVPQITHPEAGKVLKKGIDFFIGDEWAVKWDLCVGSKPYADVKRDLTFAFEAGSTRAAYRQDQQQAGMFALNALAPWLERTQSWDSIYELLRIVNASLPLENADRRLPPRNQFVADMQAAALAQQQMAMAEQGPQDGDEVNIEHDGGAS